MRSRLGSSATRDRRAAPTSTPRCVRSSTAWCYPKPCAWHGAIYRRRRLTVPTLVVFGRQDWPWTEEVLEHLCRNRERYADRIEFAYLDDAAHFITDDAPAAVADLAIDWLERAA